ncbi:unnamed protein product, partial [Oppiella nova]
QRPKERFEFVKDTVNKIATESKDLFDELGISLDTKPIEFNARVLDKPVCMGDDRKLFEPKPLSDWFFVSIAPHFDANHDSNVEDFISRLTAEAKRMGITVSKPFVKKVDYRGADTVKLVFEKIKSLPTLPPLVVFCIPYGDGTYHQIKHMADIDVGVMTQCMKISNLMVRSCVRNLLLKINGKLDGKNTMIRDTKPPVFTTGLMVIGADVTHPAPADRMFSSVAALVGSYDPQLTRYSAAIRVQKRSKEEMILAFKDMVVELLYAYKGVKANNQNLPTSLVVFRDGVSQGQFEHVLRHEHKQLLAACAAIDLNYKPKITFVVVQKRHNTRLMPQNPYDKDVSKVGNIPAGTVVDTKIVDPVLFEYYLCSHEGAIGTSRPAKYVVLHDDNGFTFDAIERLSYYLCHAYVRSTKSLSVPIPVMYAHLAAKRAKDHIIARNQHMKTLEKQYDGDDEHRVALELNARIKVNDSLRNHFYYC